MEIKNNINIKDFTNTKNYNLSTFISLLLFVLGIIFYISWGVTYGVWADVGIYSITIVLVLSGIIGFILSLMENKNKN